MLDRLWPQLDVSTDDARITARTTAQSPRRPPDFRSPRFSSTITKPCTRANCSPRWTTATATALPSSRRKRSSTGTHTGGRCGRVRATPAGHDLARRRAGAAVDARLELARANAARYSKLAAFGSGSKQDTQAAEATLHEQTAQLEQAQAAVRAAQHQWDLLRLQQVAAEAAVHADEAVLQQAQLNLSYTRILAPMDGVVGERAVEAGNYVSPGTAMMALVPAQGMYVEAQYR